MIIKEIELYNFRIYNGLNKIDFTSEDDKNIFIVSGRNGFGKTTFLMSLVWCLYGKQMQDVDDLYNKEISDQGGYSKYIVNSLNRLAKAEGDTKFSVSITFNNVNIADIPCKEIKVTRSFDTITSTTDEVEILVDGYANELSKEVGPEIFIRDFILPKEIAKFFFFDAEKIVTLAEINTAEQRRKLSQAYSEVLGIKKYEDLKNELETLQLRLRQESASSKERIDLINLKRDVESFEVKIEDNQNRILELKENRSEKNKESRDIQEKLIRAGSKITMEELAELRIDEEKLSLRLKELQNELKESYELIPFAISGGKLLEVSKQISNEADFKAAKYQVDNVKEATNKILTELANIQRPDDLVIDHRIRTFYQNTFHELIKKHFYPNTPELPDDFPTLHEFSSTQVNEINSLINNIKLSFKESFKRINGDYLEAKNDLNSIRRKIKDAEANQEDPVIAIYRTKKDALDNEVIHIDQTIDSLNREIGEYSNEKTQKLKNIEAISRKLDVAAANKDKDELASRLVNNLKEFIADFKEQKKKSLEEQILKGLSTLMHKKGFIKKVRVDIIGEDIDIVLLNNRGDEIKKESLSKGEQQMYATALLRGLVEESDIQFPVFIDSPMQKFDEHHAENIVRYFYPNVSDQVVLFPLINKELTSKEFDILFPSIAGTFLINNIHEDKSEFKSIAPSEFLNTYNSLYNAI
ncbi:DNA sulfur modification protein DndD [Pontibacter cellulosilyticus]|uniref:DNA sulfur modification protein DndD n=1 Tax=Pontibacter cellulosilyticus TaxID=1720253 RepID=A0A923N6J4_9BACT|nr:DNA sulfur modification protein DndD [Pontibacter cellulosilyticus]MBC5991415.1 DNA sulfur modification protein DndD [Pontibacter cellulosilyticus]